MRRFFLPRGYNSKGNNFVDTDKLFAHDGSMNIDKDALHKVMSALGKRSWKSRKKKYGVDHMRKLGILSAKKKKKLAKHNTA